MDFGQCSENFQKSWEIFGKSSEIEDKIRIHARACNILYFSIYHTNEWPAPTSYCTLVSANGNTVEPRDLELG